MTSARPSARATLPAVARTSAWARTVRRGARGIAAGFLLSVCPWVVSAVEVAGVAVDETATVANQKLVLNGAGIRTRAIFKVYVAALYLPSKKDNLRDIVALAGPKRVGVTMLREVSSDELGQALVAGIRKNSTPEETRRFGVPLLHMGEVFDRIPKLKKGDSFSVDWIPNAGTVVSVGGKPVADPIPDEAFYAAILKIWLGDEPADTDLKPAMLGTR
jgi:hypothetical protein